MNLSSYLVQVENELYKTQKEIERLKVRETELINEIDSTRDVLGISKYGTTYRDEY